MTEPGVATSHLPLVDETPREGWWSGRSSSRTAWPGPAPRRHTPWGDVELVCGWNSVDFTGPVPDDDVLELIDVSYDAIVAALPKGKRPG